MHWIHLKLKRSEPKRIVISKIYLQLLFFFCETPPIVDIRLETKQTIFIFTKGEVIMNNFRKTKENTMKGIGKHSTLITFLCAAIGVGASVYFASKEIPKAKAEVKEILAKEDLTKQQKTTEVIKTTVKSTWKTALIGVGTILLVTGTSAITAANTAATVAGLTNTINLAEQKLKDYKEAVNEMPKNTREDIQSVVTQKAINRATANLKEEDYAKNDSCPDEYLWVDEYTGVKFKATYQMIGNAERVLNSKIVTEGYMTISGLYDELIEQGATFFEDEYPMMCDTHAWTSTINVDRNVTLNDRGKTIHSIWYDDVTTDF